MSFVAWLLQPIRDRIEQVRAWVRREGEFNRDRTRVLAEAQRIVYESWGSE